MGTCEYSQRLSLSLIALDITTARQFALLHNGADRHYEQVSFSPVRGDTRVLAKTNYNGDVRPLLWDPHTGQQHDFLLDELAGTELRKEDE